MTCKSYVHGYSDRERVRLRDQANTLAELLHHDTVFPPGSIVLEAGCAVGATTLIIAQKNPDTRFVSVDISWESLAKAEELILRNRIANVTFKQADIFSLPFEEKSFDHVFGCFILEHLNDPVRALVGMKSVLRPGGSITIIEGDHGSTFFYPRSEEALRAIHCQIALQASSGGNAEIGRELYPLLTKAGYSDVYVSPRMVYVDSSKKDLVEGFTRNTFTAMIEGIRDEALSRDLITASEFDTGISGLRRASEKDGVFCYTFFKGIGISA